MRIVSIVEAHSTIRPARAACAAPVAASTNSTPPAPPARPPGMRWLTAAPVRTRSRPVARAAAMLVATLLKRGSRPPRRSRANPRDGIRRRSGQTAATPSPSRRSARVNGRAPTNRPSGSCGKPSRVPWMRRKRSTRS